MSNRKLPVKSGHKKKTVKFIYANRINTNSSYFARLARRNEARLLLLRKDLESLATPTLLDEGEIDEFKKHQIRLQMEEYECSAILFCAAAIEAHINDYGSRRLTDSYFEAHLEKLDPLSKWLIVPHLVTGKSLAKKGQAYELVKGVLKWRNRLMHSKSRPVYDLESQISAARKESELQMDTACSVSKALTQLAKEAKKLDPADVYFCSGLALTQFEEDFS